MLKRISQYIQTGNYTFTIYFIIHFYVIKFYDMAEEHTNIQEVYDLFKLANKLDPNSISELEIEWYMQIKRNGGVQQSLDILNSCKPFLSKVYLL